MTTAEPFEVREPLILFSVRRTFRPGVDPYEATRFAWKIRVDRARRYGLVLARVGETVVGAFRPDEWLEATSENFPGRESEPDRWGFVGNRAEPEVWDYYVQRRVPEDLISYSPFRYCNMG
ncbi:MAG: hypothetical protein OXC56_03965 [Chloroflexi bacterium]|nr:hypothetical protein [Chloroflexota bacterium]